MKLAVRVRHTGPCLRLYVGEMPKFDEKFSPSKKRKGYSLCLFDGFGSKKNVGSDEVSWGS